MKTKGISPKKTSSRTRFAIAFSAFLFLALPLWAQSRLVWRENFETPSAKDLEGEDANGAYSIVDGNFQARMNASLEGYLWYEPGIDPASGFRIEARIKQSGSDSSCYAALAWDMEDEDNRQVLILRADGASAVAKLLKGSATMVADYRYSPAAKARDYNTLAVERRGDLLICGINGTEVSRQPYQSHGGGKIAVMYGGKQTVDIDDVRVYADKPFSGESIEPSRGSKTRYESRLDKASGSWLNGARQPMTAKWEAAAMSPGGPAEPGYTLAQAKGGTLGSATSNFEFDLSRDFAIIARMRLLSGDIDYGYGLLTDVNGKDGLQFMIAGDGSFSIQRNSGKSTATIVPWTQSPNVELFESENTLGVFRRKNILLFAINGRVVHEMPYEEWLSTTLGFCQTGAMRVRPLELRVLQEPVAPGPAVGSCDSGFGVWEYEDGSRYAGAWSGGEPHGYGSMYGSSGIILDGYWIEGGFTGAFPSVDPVRYYPVIGVSGDMGLVDASGKLLGFGLKGALGDGEPVEDTKLFASGKSVGFVDASGGERIPSGWSLVSGFHEGFAVVKDPKGATGIMDAKGGMAIQPGNYVFDPASKFQGGLIRFQAAARDAAPDGKPLYGLIGSGGQIVRQADLLSIADFSEGLALAKAKNGLYGYLDRSGAWRIPPRYDYAVSFSEGLAYTLIGFSSCYIDTLGREAFELDSHQVPGRANMMREGMLGVVRNDAYIEFLDKTGKPAFSKEDAGINMQPFSEGLAAFEDLQGRDGFLDRKGAVAIAPAFDSVGSFSQGLAAARKGDLWGYIDKKGAWKIEPIFTEALPFRPEGLAKVMTRGGWWTWIRTDGAMLWEDPEHVNLVFKEEYSSNIRNWPTGKNATMEAYIQKDYYLIIATSENGCLTGLPLPMDRSGDHAIASLLRYNSKSDAEAAGLIWDLRDGGNFLFFAVSPQGGYGIFSVRNGQMAPLADWTADAAVAKGIADNRVEVRREGGKLVFLVNDVPVRTLPWETVQGQAMGFLCMGKASLVVESLAAWDNRKPAGK